MKTKNTRFFGKTPAFFNWLKGVSITIGATSLTLSQTLSDGEVLFGVDFLTATNLVVISIICGSIAGTSQFAKKDK